MKTTHNPGMIVTLAAPFKRVTFTWTDGVESPAFVACGVTDEELDAILAARGHEGVDVDGFDVDLAWT